MHYIKPRLTEKAFATSQATNTFVLDVPAELNKHQIADAIAKQFDVKIASVRLVNRKGKTKRVMNLTGKRSANRTGSQADIKKAYVTLAKDSHLPFFNAEEEEAIKQAETKKKEAKKAEKAEKATEKKKTSVVKKLTGKAKKETK